jgi:UDP-N-acetylmuramate-alanine ligase
MKPESKHPMHIHILGICGTFMGGIAQLARSAGHTVTGCDANVYPPMSTQLEAAGIQLIEGYAPEQINLGADIYVIGNVVTRGNPLMEAILNAGLPYIPARSGWPSMCCATAKHPNGCWRSQAPMARPPPPRCWPGYSSTQASHRAFW